MAISYTCPHCGASTSVSEQYAGQTGPCARCGKSITIPMVGGGSGAAAAGAAAGGASAVLLVLAIVGIVGLCAVGGLAALLVPAVTAARGAAQRTQCSNNLKQIGLALHNYNDVYKCFPPAYIADAEGKPMHSWRVLILPYCEGMGVYQQYDFSEPWDGPNNSLLANSMPRLFACPEDTSPTPNQTHYLFVTGPKTVGDGKEALTFADVTDGLSNTVCVVEATKGVNWMEPTDLDFGQMNFIINDAAGNDVGSHHAGGANVLFMDGSVRFLGETLDAEILRNLFLRDDGNVIDQTAF